MGLKTNFLLVLVFLSAALPSFAKDENWQQKITTNSYTIATRNVENSEYLQVKAEVSLNAPVPTVSPYFSASDRCWQWQLRCGSSKLLQVNSANSNTVYVVVDMPWPIDDRDFVFDTSYTENEVDGSITLTISPSEMVLKSDYVRAKSNVTYTLTPIENNKTHLTVLMHTEFGGSTPATLVNGRLHEELKNDLEKLIALTNKNNQF